MSATENCSIVDDMRRCTSFENCERTHEEWGEFPKEKAGKGEGASKQKFQSVTSGFQP